MEDDEKLRTVVIIQSSMHSLSDKDYETVINRFKNLLIAFEYIDKDSRFWEVVNALSSCYAVVVDIDTHSRMYRYINLKKFEKNNRIVYLK